MTLLVCLIAGIVGQDATSYAVTEQGPETKQTSSRGEIVLNGVWRFVPAAEVSNKPDFSTGLIRVPGDWKKDSGDAPTVVREGTGPEWQVDRDQLARAWYERTIRIPQAWLGRRILLDLRRVSTDAEVFLDGESMGKVEWPTGIVDLTSRAKPGTEQTLRILVIATAEPSDVPVLMGVGQVGSTRSQLRWRGIMGDVLLQSRPKSAYIDDIFVKTSVRRRSIEVEVSLEDVTQPGEVVFSADMLGHDGRVERSFSQVAKVSRTGSPKLTLSWRWPNPRLWDLDRPNLYTLRLRATGRVLEDQVLQRFGFREFWIEGRQFVLNGVRIRLRPTLAYEGGVEERSREDITAMRRRGYNIQEIWPNNDEERGYTQWWEHHIAVADEMGWPLMGPSTHMDPVVSWWRQERWSDPSARAKWLETFEKRLKRYRNSPSILIWANSGNNFGHNDDQAPTRIGKSRKFSIWSQENKRWTDHHNNGDLVFAEMKKLDPTRPFMAHQGGPISDVYTANTYLNLLPLQDREEWLSHWSRHGDMPYVAVEFGTPLNCTVLRGRNGFGGAISSEPLVTEYAASLFGTDAYRWESPEYRQAIADNFVENQSYRWWMFEPTHQFGRPFQELQKLYIRNTWRSWRTWGTSGGMVPWAQAHGFETRHDGAVKDLPPFQPGMRGLYVPRIESRHRTANQKIHAAGYAVMDGNRTTMAWIGGRPDRWTEKAHNFWVGQLVRKSVILINDTRRRETFNVLCNVGRRKWKLQGALFPGETRILPIEFHAPSQPGRALLRLEGTIGAEKHTDEFALRAFSTPHSRSETVAVWDPEGKTSTMLRRYGYRVVRPHANHLGLLLVIGRNAYKTKSPPIDLERFVSRGGRVLVMTQNPEILETRFGFRTAAYASRRVFPLGSSPITTGLDGKALSDWTGFATLREAYPDPKSLPRPTSDTTPTYGWPWGMQGVVSSVMVEKPHRSGWTPLLEGEFDLAYSPLLELGVGRGKITVCTLDLEDQHSVEPVARLLLDRVVSTASRLPRVVKSADYFLLGSDSGLMEEIGASPKLITSLPEKPCLVIVGQDAGVSEQQVRLFLERGGRALFLPRTKAFGPFSLSYQESFSGSLSSPGWPEASGLSASDLRRRSASPAWLLSGQDTAAGGQLGRWKVGKGVAIFFQMDPNLLNADKRTYFRFTRWRQTRALAQVLSNLGAQFLQDRRFFTAVEDSGGSIPLLQGWEVAVTEALSIPTDQSDPGPSSQAQQALNGQMGALNWQPFRAPGYVGVLDGKVGEAVFRKTIRVPEAWAGREAVLNLGSLDDYDITSFNGEVVGKTDRSTPSWWSHRRVYRIPARLLRVGDNVLCVRIFNVQGAGGFGGPPDQIALSKVGYRAPLNLYHHDYRSDFELGDNPFRYYRW